MNPTFSNSNKSYCLESRVRIPRFRKLFVPVRSQIPHRTTGKTSSVCHNEELAQLFVIVSVDICPSLALFVLFI